ncbi:MAG: UrcA family protein [Novosphingobium sp.]
MIHFPLSIRPALLGLSATACLALAPFTVSAEAGEPVGQNANPPESSDIVVEAPRTLPKPRRANRFLGEPEVFATVRVPVMYYDLDLADPAGAKRLFDRIHNTARQACSYLDTLYPLRPDPDCVERAEDKVKAAAEAAIEGAKANKAAADSAPQPESAP